MSDFIRDTWAYWAIIAFAISVAVWADMSISHEYYSLCMSQPNATAPQCRMKQIEMNSRR